MEKTIVVVFLLCAVIQIAVCEAEPNDDQPNEDVISIMMVDIETPAMRRSKNIFPL